MHSLLGSRGLHVPHVPKCRGGHPMQIQCKLYSFADAVEEKPPGRRNRRRIKSAEQDLRNLVSGMCQMTDKQLKAIIGICGEPIVEAVKIATALPRTNQGRKRQENLVAKLLRDQMDESGLDKLADAVELSQTSSNSYVDRDVQAKVDEWREGLLAQDQEVLDEVLSRLVVAASKTTAGGSASPTDADISVTDVGGSDEDDEQEEVQDESAGVEGGGAGEGVVQVPKKGGLVSVQEFRTLLRQCQAAAEELRQLQGENKWGGAPAGGVQGPGELGPGFGSGGQQVDPELEQVLREAAARSRKATGGGSQVVSSAAAKKKKAPGAGSKAGGSVGMQAVAKKHRLLMRSLNGVLKALANEA